MTWRAQIDDRGVITRYKDTDTGEVISAKEYERRQQMQAGQYVLHPAGTLPQMTTYPAMPGAVTAAPRLPDGGGVYPAGGGFVAPSSSTPVAFPQPGTVALGSHAGEVTAGAPAPAPAVPPTTVTADGSNPLIQPGAQILNGGVPGAVGPAMPVAHAPSQPPTAGQAIQEKTLRLEGIPRGENTQQASGYKAHGFLDATSIAILLPTLVLLALIIAAAHKKRLFPWQTIRTFNPPSGLMTPREYERSFLCPPNLRRHGRLGKRNPKATWTDTDGIVLPFGFLARTHLPVTIPLGRLPNKNMFIVAPSGSGKTTLMRAIIKALMAKPCVIIALEAKANDPNLDEKREGFKYTVLPEAQQAGFDTQYFNPLDADSIHWNPLDLDPITFASSIVQDVNSLPPEEQHWAERDHGYIAGLATLLKWGAVQVAAEDENGIAADVQPLPCNPRGLMRLVNNRRNIVESLRRLKSNPNVDAAELNELTQTLSSIIRTDTDWDKNIQGVRGRLRMFKNPNVLRVTERSNIDMRAAMYKPTVLIFGAPASLGPDAESLASCFVYQLQQALHTRYGTASVLPLFAFFDEYQTLNMDIAGRLSAIVRGANGGLTVILQNISQISGRAISSDPTAPGGSELKTIFSNSAVRVVLHNADESTAKFFSDEIGKHAIIVPGISDHYDAKGFGIFPTTWNRIHSQQVVPRVDADSIKRMEKHHALVYLSPAGDSEFGETKPLMADLRGIEEIARLHLLHNVAGRFGPNGPAAPAGPGGEPAGPGFPGSPAGGPADSAPQPFATAKVTGRIVQGNWAADRTCPHCGHAPGKGKFCIECGRPLPGAAGAPPPGPLAQPAAPAFAQPAGLNPLAPGGVPGGAGEPASTMPAGVAEVSPAVQSDKAAQGQPAFATGQGQGQLPPFARTMASSQARGLQEIESPHVPSPVAQGTVPAVAPGATLGQPGAQREPVAPQQFAGQRVGNPAGAGVSAPGYGEAPTAPVRPVPAQPEPHQSALQQGAQPTMPAHHGASQPDSQAHQGGNPAASGAQGQVRFGHRETAVQRPPVTSLHPDLSRIGLPQPGKPAQRKPQSSGVEF